MKKALVFFAIVAPLCAMDKQTNNKCKEMDQTQEEQKGKKALVNFSYAQEQDPQELCEKILKDYNTNCKQHQDALLAKADVPTLIAKTYTAIKDNKPEDAARGYAYFEQRAGLDFTLLGEAQQNAYGTLSCYLSNNADAIQPENVKKMRILERANRFKDETESWIKKIVENNTCSDFAWRTILAPDDTTSISLSPKTLRIKRQAEVALYGTLQEMEE